MSFDFNTGKQLLEICKENNIPISEVMLQREIENTGLTKQEIYEKLDVSLEIMNKSVHKAVENVYPTNGGLISGNAKKVRAFLDLNPFMSKIMSNAMAYAMSVLEVNASMGLIVAAPTAGASGVLPGIIFALKDEYNLPQEKLRRCLLNAGAIGYLFTRNASVSGALAGCQAEVGVASAMAASVIACALDGTPEDSLNAASFATQNLLGLICDPIGGLVEFPCQSRNAIGVTNAFTAATLQMSGVKQYIPFDEMVEAMLKVGKSLPETLKETSLGGCATCPSACKLTK